MSQFHDNYFIPGFINLLWIHPEGDTCQTSFTTTN